MKGDTMTAHDQAMAALGSKVTYTGASTSVVSWILSSQFGVLVGILIGVAGLLINWYYKAKQDRREEREHKKRMAE
jgi:hypothetical protein